MISSNQENTFWLRFRISILGGLATAIGISMIDLLVRPPNDELQGITMIAWFGITLVAGPCLIIVGLFGRPRLVQWIHEKIWGDRPD